MPRAVFARGTVLIVSRSFTGRDTCAGNSVNARLAAEVIAAFKESTDP